MAEWHLDPVYISEHWTDEMLALMTEALIARKRRVSESLSGNRGADSIVSDDALFQSLGGRLKVVKRGH